jgi:predicted nucleic acid-binding protein
VKILFDTNVVLDLLLERQPFVMDADALIAKVERGEITGYLSATTVTTIYYIIAKSLGNDATRNHMSRLLSLFEVASVSRAVLVSALNTKFRDFEDAVLHQAARAVAVDVIVTRNSGDFAQATLPVYDPPTLLNVLKTQTQQED